MKYCLDCLKAFISPHAFNLALYNITKLDFNIWFKSTFTYSFPSRMPSLSNVLYILRFGRPWEKRICGEHTKNPMRMSNKCWMSVTFVYEYYVYTLPLIHNGHITFTLISFSFTLFILVKNTIMLMNACKKHYNGTINKLCHGYMGSVACWIANIQHETIANHTSLSLSLSYHVHITP